MVVRVEGHARARQALDLPHDVLCWGGGCHVEALQGFFQQDREGWEEVVDPRIPKGVEVRLLGLGCLGERWGLDALDGAAREFVGGLLLR